MPAPFIAAGVGIARALPYLYRGAKAAPNIIRAGLNYFKPYQMSAGVKASGNQIIQSGKYAGQKFKDVYPNLYKKGNMPKFNITSTSKSNIALQTPFYAGAAMQGYDYLTDEAEQSVANGQRTVPSPATSGGPAGMTIEEGKATGIIKDKKEQPKDDVKITSDQIKSGELDDFIKERIDLFKKYIGDDTRKRTKTAGYNAMVQFGLNLATKRGDLVEGIAESAKEPLKEFAKLGNDLMDRAASIEKAGIESGVSAYEKAEDRKIDEKAIEADILQEKIKQQARTLSRGEFITTTKTDIMGNEKLFNAITASRYDKDGNLIENAPSEEALIDQYAENLYNTYRAVELPPGQAGADLLETLPGGTMYYNPETGEYAYKQ